MTLEEFYPVIKIIGEVFNNKLSPEAVEIYFRLLKDYPVKDFHDAAMKILKTYKYSCMPKPAEFIKAMDEIRHLRIKNKNETPAIYQQPSEEDLKKIRCLVQGVINKCSA